MKKIGTLLPLTSLVSTTHPDNVFDSARLFIDWLTATNQTYWQLLPLHPTPSDYGNPSVRVNSPYSGYGIGLNQQLLPHRPDHTIDQNQLRLFTEQNGAWLKILAGYQHISSTLKNEDWVTWPEKYRVYNEDLIQTLEKNESKEFQIYITTQFLLYQEFQQLRNYARSKNIQLIGDMPFYLDLRTPLAWSHQHLFQIDKFLNDQITSGSPGVTQFPRQVWHHPLYDFNPEKISPILNLWKLRLQYLSELFDVTRIDHSAGFYFYGEMHSTDPGKDRMVAGPGDNLFIPIVNFCEKNNFQVIAEDLGDSDLTPLRTTMKNLHIPGIRIFTLGVQSQTGEIDISQLMPNNAPVNTVFYSSTHDTPTLLGYLLSLTDQQKYLIARQLDLKLDPDNLSFVKRIRKYIFNTPNPTILPLQDWLLSTSRINTPGTVSNQNWNYKMSIPIEELPTQFSEINNTT